MLYLADKLGDVIIGLNVVKVPEQTPLSAAKEFYHDDEGESCKVLKNIFDKWAGVSSHKQKYVVAFHHDVSDGIIDQAAAESANLIVLGWKKTNRLQINIGNIAQRVVANAKSHVAILKGDFIKNPKRIVVASDGKNNSRYGLVLARKLALNTNARLTILRVINPDTEEEEKENIKAHLEEIVKSCENIDVGYEIQEKYSEVDTILAKTQESDLTIIGDSSKKIKNKFLSTLPQMVANHSKNPILIIKRYEPSTRYLRFFE